MMEKTLKKNNHERLIMVSRLLFLVYIMLALYFLLFSEEFGRLEPRDGYSYNLTLFKEIERYWNWAKKSDMGMRMMLLNVAGNILCFVPYGFFVPVIFRRIRNGVTVTVAAFVFSLAVEVAQLLLRAGSFDVDDLLLNTVGGLAGYAIYCAVRKIYLKREKKK